MSNEPKSCYCFGSPCETVTVITALALSIANGKSADDLDLLVTYLNQLSNTLETIASTRSMCYDD